MTVTQPGSTNRQPLTITLLNELSTYTCADSNDIFGTNYQVTPYLPIKLVNNTSNAIPVSDLVWYLNVGTNNSPSNQFTERVKVYQLTTINGEPNITLVTQIAPKTHYIAYIPLPPYPCSLAEYFSAAIQISGNGQSQSSNTLIGQFFVDCQNCPTNGFASIINFP